MTVPGHISEIPGFQTTSISIDTTNLTLARLSELSTKSLAKLVTIYEASLKGSMQARISANAILTYSLATTLVIGLLAVKTPRENVKKVATVITSVSGLTAILAGFISLIYTFQVHDFQYWKNVCITFMNHPTV